MQLADGLYDLMLDHVDLLARLGPGIVQEIDCVVLELPTEANDRHAVVMVTVSTTDGHLLRSIGEAYEDSLPGQRGRSALTVAETRAKRRALSEIAALTGIVSTPSGATVPMEAALGHMPAPMAPLMAPASAEPVTAVLAPAVPPGIDAASTYGREAPAWQDLAKDAPEGTAAGRRLFEDTTIDLTSDSDRNASDSRRTASTDEKASLRPLTPGGQFAAAKGVVVEQSATSASLDEAIGPDVLARLLHLTRKKAESEGAPITEEEAMSRLDSYFQRAFGHVVADGTRIEGQRVIQRLVSGTGRVSPAPRRPNSVPRP